MIIQDQISDRRRSCYLIVRPGELLQLILNQSTSQLDTRLKQLDNPIKYLTLMKNHEQHQISLLMLAAFLGFDDIVRLLLSHDSTPDHVELKGRVIVSDELTINGATALYCACYQGYFTVAKTLIEFGHANVNQDTRDYRFHPLFLHAAMMNRRDVIDFLLDDKYANVNETKTFDEYQDPALGIAASEGHTSLVEYLIAKGADVNYYYEVKSEMRSWAIASAVFKGHLDIVRLLYHAGAHRALKNKHDSALLLNTAVKQMQPVIIDFLLDESVCTIEDLELIACWSVSSDFSMNARSHMLSILKIAIEQRLRLNIPKVPLEAIAIYDYQRECQTIEELDTIKDDPHRIFLEILLILERLALSRPWRSIVEPLEAYDTTLVEHEEYEKALNILIHRFSLHQRLNLRFNFASFVWFFCRMLAKNETIPVVGFLRVARLVFESCYLKEKHFKTLNTMYLIVIATKVLGQEGLSQNDQAAIYSWVRDVCRLRLTTSDGRTLLHICVDMKTNQTIEVRPWNIRRYIRFPNKSALQLLLACGSHWLDLDAVEYFGGNTPLHLLCMNSDNPDIVELLLKSGCHTDCVNRDGQTPFDYIEDFDLQALDPSRKNPSKLKCLCARLIAKERLDMDGLVALSSALKKFVVLHGHHPIEYY